MRSHATWNNVFIERTHPRNTSYKYLRTIKRRDWNDMKGKLFMTIAYDQKKPDKTYSYKKSQGSHRLVTVLPIGFSKIYYVPEQFLKISRKKAVKDAKKK